MTNCEIRLLILNNADGLKYIRRMSIFYMLKKQPIRNVCLSKSNKNYMKYKQVENVLQNEIFRTLNEIYSRYKCRIFFSDTIFVFTVLHAFLIVF